MKSTVAAFLLGSFLFLGVCANAPAQEASPAPSIAPGANPATATRAWLDTVPADKRAKSDAYFEGGYWLLLWNFLMTAGIAIFFLESKLSARLRDLAQAFTGSRALQVAFYWIVYILIVATLSFPL